MYRFARSAARAPIGTFTNITDLHPNASVRTPPRREPAANPADRTATRTPTALFRAGPSGYVDAKIARAVAVVIAAATPWTPRATMRTKREGANPAVRDESANPMIPMTNTRFWPYTSPARPLTIRNPASVSP